MGLCPTGFTWIVTANSKNYPGGKITQNRYRQQQIWTNTTPGGKSPKSLPPTTTKITPGGKSLQSLPPTTKITPGGKSPKSLLPTKNIYIYHGGKKNREAAFSPKKTKTGVHVPGRQNTVQVKCTTVQRVLCAQTVRLCGLLTGRQAFTYFLPRVLLPCILLFCCFLDLATAGHPRANKTPKHTSRVWCSSSWTTCATVVSRVWRCSRQ